MPNVPIVVSDPSINKCLSLSDTIDIMDAVGAPETIVALVFKAFGSAAIGFHEKVLPFFTVAIKVCPKLLRDQPAGSRVTFVVKDCCPHPIKYSTEAPLACADLVPATSLVIPVKSFEDIPVYEINSAPTFIVPVDGNPVVSVKVMLVPEPPVPAVSSCYKPLRVFVNPEAPP